MSVSHCCVTSTNRHVTLGIYSWHHCCSAEVAVLQASGLWIGWAALLSTCSFWGPGGRGRGSLEGALLMVTAEAQRGMSNHISPLLAAAVSCLLTSHWPRKSHGQGQSQWAQEIHLLLWYHGKDADAYVFSREMRNYDH